jgi:hypothetical protein
LHRDFIFHFQCIGDVTASGFIAFLKRLLAGARDVIFLIVDRGPAHIARKTRAFGESLNGPIRLFYLPPNSLVAIPMRRGGSIGRPGNVGRMAITGTDAAPCVPNPSLTQGSAICLDRSANEADAIRLWQDFPFQKLSHHLSICGAPCRSPLPTRVSIRC